jgi:hypothetical protein
MIMCDFCKLSSIDNFQEIAICTDTDDDIATTSSTDADTDIDMDNDTNIDMETDNFNKYHRTNNHC